MAKIIPMTWGDFKRKAEAQGIKDDDKLQYIDWGGHAGDPDNPGEAAVTVVKEGNGWTHIGDSC